MLRKIRFIYEVLIIRFIIFFTKKNKIQFLFEDLNFSLVNFTDQKKIKSIYINFKSTQSTIKDDKSLLFHSFEWLSYSKKLGGANNIKKTNKIISRWINKNSNFKTSLWSSSLIASRFINIIYSLDFISILFDNKLKKNVYNSLYFHFLLLKKQVGFDYKILKISDAKALLLGSCIYKKGINNSLKIIDYLLHEQIDSLGFHKSYNALEHAKFINNLNEIKNIFLFFNIPVNNKLTFQINNMSAVLQNLFHKDNSLILFNGSRNSNLNEVNKVLELTKDIIPKTINSNEEGLVFYKDKKKSIFMDIVKPLNQSINNTLHSGTLAFELSCDGEKIITNCGSINKEVFNESDYLKYSAAHSTIILNNTNISELNIKKSYRRVPDKISFNKENEENYLLWTASHNGYMQNYKRIVTRKIKINKKINEIIGEDSIISTKIDSKKIIYHIRFHLMPFCNCILTNDKKTVILQIKKQSWVFKTNTNLSIEDSIYVNNNNQIEQTKQIVISGYITDKKKIENWIITKHD